jgi:hypothetical protein
MDDTTQYRIEYVNISFDAPLDFAFESLARGCCHLIKQGHYVGSIAWPRIAVRPDVTNEEYTGLAAAVQHQ